MSSYTVETRSGQIGVHDKQLTANTPDVVTFTVGVEHVIVLTDGTAAVFFTVDGSTPTVGGNNTFEVPVASGWTASQPTGVREETSGIPSGEVLISLISTGTPKYTVQKLA